MRLHPCCKINIGLDVVSKREDGYHSLESVMIPILGLCDTLDIEVREGSREVIFRNAGIEVDCPAEDNICIRAVRLMQSRFGERVGGVDITLDKQIPFGAGLGGGSADATATLLAIDQLFSLNLSEEELIDLAAQLGSDTPFFVRNSPQLCSGRGEVMESVALPQIEGKWIAIIKPEGVNISTKEAFGGITPAQPTTPLRELITEPIERWQGSIKNDFEPHIFELYPLLRQIKSDLLAAGAIYASMSGSGSTLYGIFDDPQKAKSEQLRSYSPYIFKL